MRFFIVFFLLSSAVFAQTEVPAPFTFAGLILEKGTRKPLTDVNIYLLPMKLKAVSDKEGRFEFKGVPDAKVHVVVNLTNYNRYERDLDLAGLASFNIYLEKQPQLYFETTIQDTRTKKDDSQQTLQQEDFMKMPGSNGDPVKAVQNLPGVNRPSGFSSQVIIQGSSPADTRYNVEGIDVPMIFHFGGFSSIVMPEAISSVDLLSAGYGPSYSDALGGHVGLNIRDPQMDRQHGMAFMDFFNAGGLIEGPLSPDSGYTFGGRYSYIGQVLDAASSHSNSGNSLTAAPTSYDINTQYFKKISANEDFRLLGIMSSDDLGLLLTKSSSPSVIGDFHEHTQFWRLIPEWRKTYDNGSKIDVTLGYGVNDVLVDIGSNYYDIKSNESSARAEYQYPVTNWWKTAIGVDANMTSYNANVQAPIGSSGGGGVGNNASGSTVMINERLQSNILGYLWKNDLKPGADSPLTISPGLRVDQFTLTKQTLAEPRLAAKYDLNPSLSFKAMSGLYYELPEVQAMDSNVGNPDLKAERAIHFAIGADKTFEQVDGRSTSLSVLGFYKKLDQLVVSSSDLVTRDGQLVSENYNNDGKGYVQGFEISSKIKKDNWSLIVNYTFSQSFLQQPGQSYYPSPYDQTHSLALLGNYKTGVWEYSGRLRYVTGDPYTPIVGSYYNDQSGVYVPQVGSYYSARLPAFFQLDLRMDRKWVYDTWILSLYLDIQNITNRKNVESQSYSYDYSQSQYVTDLPILPTFGVKGEF